MLQYQYKAGKRKVPVRVPRLSDVRKREGCCGLQTRLQPDRFLDEGLNIDVNV